jgi:hypothetical protein
MATKGFANFLERGLDIKVAINPPLKIKRFPKLNEFLGKQFTFPK